MKSSAKKVPRSELSAVWKIDRLKTSLQKPAVVYSEFMWPVYVTHALCVNSTSVDDLFQLRGVAVNRGCLTARDRRQIFS